MVAAYHTSLSGINVLQFVMYTIGLQTLLFHMQWEFKNDLNTYGGSCALLLLLQRFLMPYKIFTVMGIVFAVIAYILFRSQYYLYEIPAGENSKSKQQPPG